MTHFLFSIHKIFSIAEWEARKNIDQKTPSQKMKMEVDTEIIHQQETPTPYSRAITTTAESYQMTKSEDLIRRPSQQADSSLSVSPAVTTPPRNIINNAQEVGRVHVLPDDRNNLANSGEFIHCFNHLHLFIFIYYSNTRFFLKKTLLLLSFIKYKKGQPKIIFKINYTIYIIFINI